MLLPCSRKEVELIARSAVAVAVAFVLCGRERCWKSRVDLIRTCLHCLSGGPTDDEVESRSTSSWIILLTCLFLAILLVFYIHPFIYLVSTFIIYKEIQTAIMDHHLMHHADMDMGHGGHGDMDMGQCNMNVSRATKDIPVVRDIY